MTTESTEQLIARLTQERDAARASIVELMEDSTKKLNEIRQLKKDVDLMADQAQYFTRKFFDARPLSGMVYQFHRKFSVPMAYEPTVPSDAEVRLRVKLIAEEFIELLEATFKLHPGEELSELHDLLGQAIDVAELNVDLVKFVDALADIRYTAVGADLVFGVDSEAVDRVVHASNMTKDGKHIPGGLHKITKGPGYVPPNILGELIAQGWEGPNADAA